MRRPRLVPPLALFLGLTLPLGVPDAQEALERPTPGFTGRDREMMHPGDPLDLVGIEQEGNSIRARTPALERSDRRVALVDEDELHDRKLAMYAGATLRLAPSRVGPAHDSAPPRRKAKPPRPDKDPLEEGHGAPWLAMVLGAAFTGLVAYVVLRKE